MGPVDLVIAAAGSGERLGHDCPKAFVEVAGAPLLEWAMRTAAAVAVRRTVVTVPAEDPQRWIDRAKDLKGPPRHFVCGGATRQASVRAGIERLDELAAGEDGSNTLVLVHDAARPCGCPELWQRVVTAADETGAAIPALWSVDSLKEIDADNKVVRSIDRTRVVRAQTPQCFRFDWLLEAHRADSAAAGATDDAALIERLGHPVAVVPGDPDNIKVTTPSDLRAVREALGGGGPGVAIRVGYGFDIHALVEGRRLVLGGVEIEYDRGLLGHSDADSLAHAVTDALLGAAGLGDIGMKFPADDPQWKDADSLEMLGAVVSDLQAAGVRPVNVDATILAEQPRLAPHLQAMRENLATWLRLPPSAVNVKATRGEGLGSIGRSEGIAAHAVVTIGPL